MSRLSAAGRSTAPGISALRAAVADLDPPFGVLDGAALIANADDLVRRAAGKPIRVATKSVRVRAVLEMMLARPGFGGLLAYTLPEALWLHECGFTDIVVGYPTSSRPALRQLSRSESAATAVTVMIDDVAQLDLIDAVSAPSSRPDIRIAIEMDAGYRPLAPAVHIGGVHVGARRSPLHDPAAVADLAREVVRRRGFRLVGMMIYESQIAGVGDAGAGLRARTVRVMQRASAAELVERRAAGVAAVRAFADLEFVNGGGTGSVQATASEPAITEIAAGSGLFAPTLFDRYRGFQVRPAAYFVLPVVRRPTSHLATVLGGGWVASGPPGPDRLPLVVDPPGLEFLPAEGAGEVQTPLRGGAATDLRVGDTVWLRHAKAGELSEHLTEFQLVEEGTVTAGLPTYRGDGKAFL